MGSFCQNLPVVGTDVLAGVAQEVSAPLDAISGNVRAIKQHLAPESASPLLRPFVDKIRNVADIIEKDSDYAKALLKTFAAK